MKSLALVSLFASLVLAQISYNSPTNSLIPAGISQACGAYYTQLSANATLTQCLQPLITATQSFGPGSTSAVSCPSTVTSALTDICTSSNTCDSSLIGAQLALFYQACQPELTSSKVAGVVLTYDILYLLGPFRDVVCQKDDSGKYCVANATSSPTKRASLDRRDDSQVALVPNATQFNQDGIMFLGLGPSLTADKLCTSCTRNVMNVYISQLNKLPYAPGIAYSLLLAGQSALYDAIKTKCGATFLGGQVQAAGGLATGAAPRSADGAFALVSSVITAIAVGAIALL
ncbi:hypothetical protein BJV78DRAFT_1231816 [Lactifluus subvellereus]|nr:hypothetical protein BJV78DRAFT_1231816 [Lactifluus subvellereus]